MTRWQRALDSGPFIVSDGGLATELARRGHDLSDALWSARLLLDDPQAIGRVHLDYFRAGADIATTASYQASIAGLAARGLDEVAAHDILRRSVQLAVQARARADASLADDRTRLVAASAGSFGATLADGSEYTGDFGARDHAALVAFHRERARVLAEGADILAFETIPSLAEVEAIAEATAALPIGAWVSMTIRDGRTLASGEALVRAARVLDAAPHVVAIGINCCAPWHVEQALVTLQAATTKPLVAYPNAGEHYDGHARRFRGTPLPPSAFAALAQRYLAAGARVLGTCCRTGLAHIAVLDRIRRGHVQ
jgi:homocysteine S-methyltransferase